MKKIQVFPESRIKGSITTILGGKEILKERLIPDGPIPMENEFAIGSQGEQSAKLIA
jgi:hypothetical protein